MEMKMADNYEFSAKAIDNALAAARSAHDTTKLQASGAKASILAAGDLSLTAECISVTVQNNKVCLNLPLGIGSVCLPIPVSFPNGTAAQACLSICTTWGIPTGVQATVSIMGNVIVRQSFGKC